MTACIRLVAVLALLTCSACISISVGGSSGWGWGASYDHVAEPVTRGIAIAPGAPVTITADAGTLEVRRALGPEVVVTGTAAADSEELLAQTGFSLWDVDGEVFVRVDAPGYSKVDLVVEVPDGNPVTIRDGSGSIRVRDVASVWIDDGSGSIRVEGVAGPVHVEDGSGSLDVFDVVGPVTVIDGSGSIEVRGVTTDVVVERDGSGSIDVRDVAGDLHVHESGSGSVSHRRVGGDVWIDD